VTWLFAQVEKIGSWHAGAQKSEISFPTCRWIRKTPSECWRTWFFTFCFACLRPTISSVSPTSGSGGGGYIATITGTNFVSGISDNTALIGGAECPIKSASSTEIVCSVPAHAPGSSFVEVANVGGKSNEVVEFLYQLAITTVDYGGSSVSLSLGGGIQITVQGSGFQSGPRNASIALTMYGDEQFILGVYSINSSATLQGNFTLSMRGLMTPSLDVMASSEEVKETARFRVDFFPSIVEVPVIFFRASVIMDWIGSKSQKAVCELESSDWTLKPFVN